MAFLKGQPLHQAMALGVKALVWLARARMLLRPKQVMWLVILARLASAKPTPLIWLRQVLLT